MPSLHAENVNLIDKEDGKLENHDETFILLSVILTDTPLAIA